MTFRKLMQKTHLWLGVPVSLIVAWVALSGALLAFQDDIRHHFLYPSPSYEIPQGATLLSPHQLKARLLDQVKIAGENAPSKEASTAAPTEQKHGRGGHAGGKDKGENKGIRAVEYRSAGEAAVFATGNRRSPEGETLYFVNPYTGELLTRYTTANDVFRFIMRGHRWLWLPQAVGRPIVGVATLIFVVLILSGIVMWLPKKIKKATITHALSLSTKGGKSAVTKRWHGALGAYLAIFGLVFALTGLTWSFEWYRSAYASAWGVGPRQAPATSTPTTDSTATDSVQLGLLFDQLCQTLPIGKEGRTTFNFVRKPTDAYTVSYYHNIYSHTEKDTHSFDRYTLQPIQTDLYAEKPLNVRLGSATYDLHTGNFFGLTGRIIFFIASLAIASLPLTGLWVVINRKRKKKTKQQG